MKLTKGVRIDSGGFEDSPSTKLSPKDKDLYLTILASASPVLRDAMDWLHNILAIGWLLGLLFFWSWDVYQLVLIFDDINDYNVAHHLHQDERFFGLSPKPVQGKN